MNDTATTYTTLDTPLGRLLVAAGVGGLRRVSFLDGEHPSPPEPGWRETADPAGHPVLGPALAQLREYFAGRRRGFDLPLDADGTPFQQTVWAALREIPYGETWSYGRLARRLGRPGASRAVGAANGANPVPVVVPCHRVVGADGSLTGYGEGLAVKAGLLRLEQG